MQPIKPLPFLSRYSKYPLLSTYWGSVKCQRQATTATFQAPLNGGLIDLNKLATYRNFGTLLDTIRRVEAADFLPCAVC